MVLLTVTKTLMGSELPLVLLIMVTPSALQVAQDDNRGAL